MPRIVGASSRRLLLGLAALILVFGFTPIAHFLLGAVGGSFAPASYSSLALAAPSDVGPGVRAGALIPVKLLNQTGHIEVYHWSATQNGTLVSLGEDTLGPGRSSTILVPSQGATAGKLRIALNGTNVYVTVPMLKP
jgi:hypothetical protein